jgi:MOSC domain-containing protein YiiM
MISHFDFDKESIVKIVSLAVSKAKGTRKSLVSNIRLIENHGLEKDAHAGDWHRQVSFLANESIQDARQKGLTVDFGDFAENIATEGIDWPAVPIGTIVKLGREAEVEITQIGKTCHRKCAIYYQAGDCIMPREGVFGKVLKGGNIQVGDPIQIVHSPDIATSAAL